MSDTAIDLIVRLNAALRQLKLYTPDHPVCGAAIDAAVAAAERVLEDAEWFTIGLPEGSVMCQGRPLLELGNRADALLTALCGLGAEWIRFGKGLTREELELWLVYLNKVLHGEDVESTHSWPAMKILMGIPHDEAKDAPLEPKAKELAETFSSWLRGGRQTDVDELACLIGRAEESVAAREMPLDMLETSLECDEYLVRRGMLVSLMTMTLARAAGLPRKIIHEIGLGGLLCDVGLGSVDEATLASKQGEFGSPALWAEHPVLGAEMLARCSASSIPLIVVSEHHWGLRHASPTRHPYSEIVGLADDIIGRILGGYGHAGHRLDLALIGLARDGFHYRPELIWRLFETAAIFVEGAQIRLSNKMRATIAEMNPRNPLRPRVFLEDASEAEPPTDLAVSEEGLSIAALVYE